MMAGMEMGRGMKGVGKFYVLLRLNSWQMKIIRLRFMTGVVALMLLAFAGSCTSQRFTTHQTSHPKRCNCPSFK